MHVIKTGLKFTEEEREIIPAAIEAARDLFVPKFGKRARMRDNEAKAFTYSLLNDSEVPFIALVFVCYGLERLWWVENKRIPGIPELLTRLERLCGYRRTGGEPPRIGR